MRRALAAVLVAGLLLPGCYRGPDPDLTESGKGRPVVTAEAPAEAERGDTVEVSIEVSNPGPGDMESVVVAFSRVGDPRLPDPIVEVGTGGRSEGVASVDPEPAVISPDGVIYRFGALAEGGSTTITFDLVIPDIRGTVGNAVTVYDGAEPERARGDRILITVN